MLVGAQSQTSSRAASSELRARVDDCAGGLQVAVQTNFARNFPRSFFETTRKRCNSNDLTSLFEILAGELRAKLLSVEQDMGTTCDLAE